MRRFFYGTLDLGLHRDGHRLVEPLLQQPVRVRQPVLPGAPEQLQHLET